ACVRSLARRRRSRGRALRRAPPPACRGGWRRGVRCARVARRVRARSERPADQSLRAVLDGLHRSPVGFHCASAGDAACADRPRPRAAMTRAHLAAWARERFPLANGAFFVLMYVLALVVGRSSVSGPIVLSWRDVPGVAALWSFFFWLRVLDEHKDFENDRV